MVNRTHLADQISKEKIRAVSSPVNTFIAPKAIDNVQKESGAKQLAGVLSAINPALKAYSGKASKEEEAAQKAMALRDFTTGKNKNTSWQEYLNSDEFSTSTPIYQATMSKLLGKQQAQAQVAELSEEYNAFKLENPGADFQSYLAENPLESLDANSNEHFTSGYANTLYQSIESLNAKDMQTNAKIRKEAMADSLAQTLDESIAAIYQAGGKPEDIHKETKGLYGLFKQLGIPAQAGEESVILKLADKYASEGNVVAAEGLLKFKRANKTSLIDEVSDNGSKANAILNVAKQKNLENQRVSSAKLEADLSVSSNTGSMDVARATDAFKNQFISRKKYVSGVSTV